MQVNVGMPLTMENAMSTKNLVGLIERLLERAADAAAEKFGVAELLREAAKAIKAMMHEPKAEAGKEAWKPIETAPKDNERKLYLARFNDNGELQELDYDGGWEHWVESWELSHINGYDWVSANGMEEPTHWSYQDDPLPSSPVQPHPEHLALLRGIAQEDEPRAPQRCNMGVGCDEAGTCYAAAQGESDRCGRAEQSPETVTVQEAWNWAGGNPEIKATRAELEVALRDLDKVGDEADSQPRLDDEEAVGTVLGGIFHYLRPDHGLPDNTKLYARPTAGKVEAAIFIQFTADGKHIRFWTRDHARALEETFCHARPLTSFYARPGGAQVETARSSS